MLLCNGLAAVAFTVGLDEEVVEAMDESEVVGGMKIDETVEPV